MLIFLFLLPFVASDTCDTTTCRRLASRFRQNMFPSVSPCDNFHEYVCGTYPRLHNLSDHEFVMMPFDEMQKVIDDRLSELLNASVADATSREMALAITYYESCRDEARKSELGTRPLLETLRDTFGGWAVLGQRQATTRSWEAVAGRLAAHGVGATFEAYVWDNPLDTTQRIMQVGLVKTFMTKSDYRVNATANWTMTNLDHYRNFMIEFLTILGADNLTISEKVDEILDFETALAHVGMVDSKDKYGETGVQMTFGEMCANYSNINFYDFFNQEMRDTSLGAIDDATLIQNLAPDFFASLDALIAATDATTIVDYLQWRTVLEMSTYLSRELREPLDALLRILIGSNSDVQCHKETREKFTSPLGAAFVRDYFSDEDRATVAEMVGELREAMRHEIEEAEWMDEETAKAALVKLDAMTSKIGFPDSIFNATEISRQYGWVGLDAGDYLKNAMTLKKVQQTDQWYNMRRDELDWRVYVLAVNAYYNPHRNAMMLPASISHFPLLVAGAPAAVNYGAYGVIVGHEMTHGFDDGGSLHNAQGNLENWWDQETKEHFKNKTKCFIKQYARETEPKTGLKYNGKLTLGENIADNGGLRMAWMAYRKMREKFGEKSLIGMEMFSNDQLFFIAHANTWCVNPRTEMIDDWMLSDVHTFGAARVNLPLRNLPAFGEAFNCPVGSPMRPSDDKICRVW